MKRMIVFISAGFLLATGCGDSIQCADHCVEVVAGDLQPGLELDYSCGSIQIAEVTRNGNNPIGFKMQASAPNSFFIVSTSTNVECSDGTKFISPEPISRVLFCTASTHDNACNEQKQ